MQDRGNSAISSQWYHCDVLISVAYFVHPLFKEVLIAILMGIVFTRAKECDFISCYPFYFTIYFFQNLQKFYSWGFTTPEFLVGFFFSWLPQRLQSLSRPRSKLPWQVPLDKDILCCILNRKANQNPIISLPSYFTTLQSIHFLFLIKRSCNHPVNTLVTRNL